jgi:hypothetical protein
MVAGSNGRQQHALDPGQVSYLDRVVQAGCEFVACLDDVLIVEGGRVGPFEEVRLAVAAHAMHTTLRLDPESMAGLPGDVLNELRLLEVAFNDPGRAWHRWQWSLVLSTDGDKLVAERWRQYVGEVLFPLMNAAMSIAKGGLVVGEQRDWASRGWAWGFQATLSPDEAAGRWPVDMARYRSSPVVGDVFPICEPNDIDAVHRPLERLRLLLEGQRQPAGDVVPETADASSPAAKLPGLVALSPPASGSKALVELHPAVVADPYDDLIGEMRLKRGTVRPAFLEYMKTRRRATVEDISEHVHGDEQTSEEAVRKNVERVNEDLAGKSIPIRFIVGSGYVHKEDQPA